MAKDNFPTCLKITLEHEGGWSDHPKDPGGATMKGITLATYRQWVPGASKADLRAISDGYVSTIYETGYWQPVKAELLPAGVDLAVFDLAVNSGPGRAAKTLQAAVGVAKDGQIGSITLSKANQVGDVALVRDICARRLSFLRGLKTFSTFGKGWVRRVADVEAHGVKMALASVGTAAGAKMAMEDAAAQIEGRASAQDRAGAASGASGAGAVGTAAGATDLNWWIIAGVAVVVIAAVALVKSRASVNRERADAYRRVA